MTLSEHISKMKERIRELENVDKPVYFASNSALAEFSERVFTNGQDTSGGRFVYEGTKPLYVNPKDSPKGFEPRGKPRGSGETFKSGKKKGQEKTFRPIKKQVKFAALKFQVDLKTRWFESYLDFRKYIGLEYSFVNWNLFGDLKSEIENRSGSNFQTRKIEDGVFAIKTISAENTTKLVGKGTGGLRKKYPNVFELSEAEKKTYFRIFDLEFKRILKETFNR